MWSSSQADTHAQHTLLLEWNLGIGDTVSGWGIYRRTWLRERDIYIVNDAIFKSETISF